MQYLSNSRRIARALKPLALLEADVRFASHVVDSTQWQNHRSPSVSVSPGTISSFHAFLQCLVSERGHKLKTLCGTDSKDLTFLCNLVSY